MRTHNFAGMPRRSGPAAWRGVPALLAIAALIFAAACGGEPTPTPSPAPTAAPPLTPTAPSFARETPRPISLPADEAPHSDPLEWWYYNGRMQDADGNEYGFHFVIFQVRDPGGSAFYVSHASLLDVAAERHEQASDFGLGPQPQPSAGFSIDVEGWTLSGDNGDHTFTASTDAFAFDLSVSATKPAVLHNEQSGYLGADDADSTGLAGWTYYYSWTNMDLSGTLTLDGQERSVIGSAWMDHQWGDFEVPQYPGGWDWFAVSLDNGYEVMISRSRSPIGGAGDAFTYGTLVAPSGETTHIDASDISLRSLNRWVSPHTDGDYPIEWRIEIPKHGIAMTLAPEAPDQEFTNVVPPVPNYWEGLVTADITVDGEPVGGSAYMELVGYARRHVSQTAGGA